MDSAQADLNLDICRARLDRAINDGNRIGKKGKVPEIGGLRPTLPDAINAMARSYW